MGWIELDRTQPEKAIIVASVRSARWLLERQHIWDRPLGDDHLLALVMGRTVAHEIGQYLQGSAAHSPHGLMRTVLPTNELVEASSRPFRVASVSEAQRTACARRWTPRPP